MTYQVHPVPEPEERRDELASRVLQNYFLFRDNDERFADAFLDAYALHLGIDSDLVRMVYDSGRKEARTLLKVHPEYVVIPILDKMH